MANSQVSIGNRALQAIGNRTTISSLAEASNEARNLNLIFQDTVQELLSMAFWNFAKKTDYLSLTKSAPGTPTNQTPVSSQWVTAYPAPPWLYEYAYPTDCIQMRKIVQQAQNFYIGVPLTSNGLSAYPYAVGPGARFEVASGTDVNGQRQNVILTNQYQAIGVYTMDLSTEPGLWSSQFVEALVQALSAKLAIPLTGQVKLANTKFAQANAIIVQARASDGNEGLTIIDSMPDWITIRDDYGYDCGDAGFIAPYGPLYGVVG
jgi:hypothetical protein